MAKKNAKKEILSDLSHKARQALGCLIADNGTLYVTPADIADRVCSAYSTLTQDEVNEIHSRVGTTLAQMYHKGNCDLFRTEHKIQPRSTGRKAQFGYRIGPAMTPLRTTEVRLEERLTTEAAVAVLEDPIAFLNSIKGQLPLLKLNALIVELVNELQNRVMAQHLEVVELDRRLKVLAADFPTTVK